MGRNEREWDLVCASLRAASVDPSDFAQFVNRPYPGVIEPSHFDDAAATPVLLDWLPKVTDKALKETIIRRLRNPAGKRVATEPLIREFTSTDDDNVRWVAGDALQYVADAQQRPSLLVLASDKRYGKGRQMLFEAIGRLTTSEAVRTARQALTDPDVALHAGSAYRRLVSEDEALAQLERLARHSNPAIATAATMNLKRLARAAKKNA